MKGLVGTPKLVNPHRDPVELRAQISELQELVQELRANNAELERRIKSPCPACGHTVTEDGCAFCLKGELVKARELYGQAVKRGASERGSVAQ